MPIHDLSDAEVERLAMLIEECGEIIQIACNILRHGYEPKHPHHAPSATNRMLLEMEIGDARSSMALMAFHGDIDHVRVIEHARTKPAKRNAWIHEPENQIEIVGDHYRIINQGPKG